MIYINGENGNVFYGNHLYEHWNYFSLNRDEFIYQYSKNREELGQFKNHLDYFAFTNGMHPDLDITHNIFSKLGTNKIFTSKNGFNKNHGEFVLGRVANVII